MELGTDKNVMIASAMTSSDSPICHPEYFRGKTALFGHLETFQRQRKKRGTIYDTFVHITYTFYRDSSVLKSGDNDLTSDINNISSRVIRRFYKEKEKGSEDRWKDLCQVQTSYPNDLNEKYDT